MLVDPFPGKASWSLDQAPSDCLKQPLSPQTGRSIVHTLYPVSLGGFLAENQPLDLYRKFESFLLYGIR
jgi:hypothetical protein